MPALYWYHTPEGRFRTVNEAAEGNGIHRRAIEYRTGSELWPEFYKTPRKADTWWQKAPVEELTELQLKRRRKWENERKEHLKEKRRKFKTPEELTEYRRQVASRVFNDPEYRKRQKEAWQKYNENLTEEDYAKRAKKHSENYWRKIEETIGIEKHKERQRKKLNRYHKHKERKKRKKERKEREKILKEKRVRLQGLKIWRDYTDNHYKEYERNGYTLHRICKNCGKDDVVDMPNSSYCSKWCANVEKSGIKWTKEFLINLNSNSKSFSANASMLGVDRGTLLRHYMDAGIEPNIRDYSQRLSSWLSRRGTVRPASELAEVLKDDDPLTNTRYLPDEIEDFMEDLDDFFS